MAKRKAEVVPDKPCKQPIKTMGKLNVAICIPLTAISGSNARNLEQVTHIVYQIARACTIFNVVEIVVLDVPEPRSTAQESLLGQGGKKKTFDFADEDITPEQTHAPQYSLEAILLSQMLQFFVTPPYLVKSLFNQSPVATTRNVAKQLGYAAKLPKISTLPFMGNNKVYRDYKEGLSIAKETPRTAGKSGKGKKLTVTRYVNIGEREPLELIQSQLVPVNARVTVDLKNRKVVSPQTAYGIQGALGRFGYHVRVCKRFTSVFTESAVGDEGYTLCVYVSSQDFQGNDQQTSAVQNMEEYKLENSKEEGTVLLMFGKYSDLSRSFDLDKGELGLENAAEMFDSRLKIPTGMRTEDAALVALAKVC